MLFRSDLREAHRLKEAFYEIFQMRSYKQQREELSSWILYAEKSGIKEFKTCVTAFRNWKKEILNALKYQYTNGVTEGFNNKIKVLKRNSYGIINFRRFRTRILLSTS